MYELTPEQKEATEKKILEIFPGNRLEELSKDNSLQTWWVSISDEIRKAMYKIDCDQARSMAQAHTKYVV